MKRTSSLLISLLATGIGLGVGWKLGGSREDGMEGTMPRPSKSADRSVKTGQGSGAAMLLDWSGQIEQAPDAKLPELARLLADDPRRNDPALWMPLIARWSESDPVAMIGFLESSAPIPLREQLLLSAWYAWGAVDPDAAFVAGKELPSKMMKGLLEGIAETNPGKAAEFVTKAPDSQMMIWAIADRVSRDDPDAAGDLMKRAVYDGARMPLQKAKLDQLAATDPAAAIACARGFGVIGQDPVPGAVEAIAKLDPAKAVAEVEAMPSSRSKALSTVALARTWMHQDPEAALSWTRAQPAGPVRQAALVAAARELSGPDPKRALELVSEAGWDLKVDFYNVADAGSLIPSELGDAPTPIRVAGEALRAWVETDPSGARNYLSKEVPAGMREALAREAAMEP